MNARSRYTTGVTTIKHKGVDVTTNVGTAFDDALTRVDEVKLRIGQLPLQHEGRPDLVSYVFTDTPYAWWIFMHTNNIWDPFQDMQAGRFVRVPNE